MAQDDLRCQELLAPVLWIRRSSVTLAFGVLSRAGPIDHAQGCIKNRQGLEAAPCERNGMVHKYFARLSS